MLSVFVYLLVPLNCIFVCIKLFSFHFVSFVVIFIFSVFLTPQSAPRTPHPAPRPRVFGTPRTIRIFIKSPEEGRLDCPKYRENQLACRFFFAVFLL